MEILVLAMEVILIVFFGFCALILWLIAFIATEEYLKDIVLDFPGKNLSIFVLSFILSPFSLVLFTLGILGYVVSLAWQRLTGWINSELQIIQG